MDDTMPDTLADPCGYLGRDPQTHVCGILKGKRFRAWFTKAGEREFVGPPRLIFMRAVQDLEAEQDRRISRLSPSPRTEQSDV